MKIALQLKLEEAIMFVSGLYVLFYAHMEWWWYLLMLIGPDVSMLGYLAGNKVGAATYNFFHSKTIGIVCVLTGLYLDHQLMVMIGVVIVAHASFDRMMGYGLKLNEGFKYTHLGVIGKK